MVIPQAKTGKIVRAFIDDVSKVPGGMKTVIELKKISVEQRQKRELSFISTCKTLWQMLTTKYQNIMKL